MLYPSIARSALVTRLCPSNEPEPQAKAAALALSRRRWVTRNWNDPPCCSFWLQRFLGHPSYLNLITLPFLSLVYPRQAIPRPARELQLDIYTVISTNRASNIRRTHSLWHRWSSGRIRPCHGRDPGSIPGRCSLSTNETSILLAAYFLLLTMNVLSH